jgi:hypothetical protein
MPHLIWRHKEPESLKTVGREIGNDGDWTDYLVGDFCKIMSIIVPSFAEQSRQKAGISQQQKPELDQRRAYDCHAFVENILQKDVCIFCIGINWYCILQYRVPGGLLPNLFPEMVA